MRKCKVCGDPEEPHEHTHPFIPVQCRMPAQEQDLALFIQMEEDEARHRRAMKRGWKIVPCSDTLTAEERRKMHMRLEIVAERLKSSINLTFCTVVDKERVG